MPGRAIKLEPAHDGAAVLQRTVPAAAPARRSAWASTLLPGLQTFLLAARRDAWRRAGGELRHQQISGPAGARARRAGRGLAARGAQQPARRRPVGQRPRRRPLRADHLPAERRRRGADLRHVAGPARLRAGRHGLAGSDDDAGRRPSASGVAEDRGHADLSLSVRRPRCATSRSCFPTTCTFASRARC